MSNGQIVTDTQVRGNNTQETSHPKEWRTRGLDLFFDHKSRKAEKVL